MHELPWITIFGLRVGRFANDFHEWRVTSENHLQIASRVTPKLLFTVTNLLFYFLHAIVSWTVHNSAKNNYRSLISPLPLRTGRSLLIWYRDVTTVDHANAGYWHCDIIFVDCSCTCKLVQRRSSLVNNNREYQFLITRYSRLSV